MLVTPPAQDGGAAIASGFARRVEERSRGALRLRVVAAAAGEDPLARVRTGAAQLAIVPSEALRREHVHTLDALRAPFLITTDELAARATSGRFAGRLLSGLDAASLRGIALVPESLYRPFGFLKPLASPSDFSGLRIGAPRSPAVRELLRALGARPVDPESEDAPASAVYAGFGLDRPGRRASDAYPQDAYTASNVALFPKVDVIVAATRPFERLSARDRTALAAAARDVRAATILANESHTADRAFCAAGGSIETALPRDLAALRQRTRPLRAALARDRMSRELINEIARLAPGRGASCASSESPAPPEPPPDVGRDVRARVVPPPGSYRRAFTATQLRVAGAGGAEAEAGVLTLTFWGAIDKRQFALEWQQNRRPPCRGHVFWGRGIAELRWNPATPCTGYAAFDWQHAGGDLRITRVAKETAAHWARLLHPGTWKRVDCDPLEAEMGIEPGRARPCPGGAERYVLSRRGREGASTSPHGRQVVVETELADSGGLVVGNPDGTHMRWITHYSRTGRSLREDGWPRFSPDGAWIAFLRGRWHRGKPWGTGGVAVFVIAPDGSRLTRLTPFTSFRRLPSRLTFSSAGRLYTLRREDAHLTWIRSGTAAAPER